MNFESNKKYDQPIIKLNQPDDNYKIQPLPVPIGSYPYHLELEKLMTVSHDKFSFHMVGDTGGVLDPNSQQKIAAQMHEQFAQHSTTDQPAFLYHLGDVVYHYGEAEHYEKQFFKPYQEYPRPIFAIAGNHDSDVNPNNPVPYRSLDAFSAVFCDTESRNIDFIKNKQRKSMVQPNIYWTLQTPLANIIGLHSNVPKYGFVGEDQRKWFVEELKAAAKERPGKLIIVCIHHAPYSADINHGSSLAMVTFLEDAFKDSGVRPDSIFSGHVHNYQRFHKTYPDEKILPFIVCGAGGFDELHALATIDDPAYTPGHPLLDNVHLQNYCDSKHGFLKVTLERKATGIALSGEYFVLCDNGDKHIQVDLRDSFYYLL